MTKTPTQFIAVDGEGVDVWVEQEFYDEESGEFVVELVKEHQYVLLSVGEESLHMHGQPLTYREIFPFLWEQFEKSPHAAYVGFYLGYDFTMWLKQLDRVDAWKLLTRDGVNGRQGSGASPFPFPVRVGGEGDEWEIDILGAKRFKLRPYIAEPPTRVVHHRDGTMSEQKLPRPWMFICDSGSFYQTALLKAIDPKDWKEGTGIVTETEYEILREGKANRSTARFTTAADRAQMMRYNVLENDVLARLMDRLNAGLLSDNIVLNRQQWMGPGQAAQAWLKTLDVTPSLDLFDCVPLWASEAARMTYFGGWFEIFVHGHVPGTSWAYDINSAYPSIIATLPCLEHGQWLRGKGKPRKVHTPYRMVYAHVEGSDPTVGAMLHRNHDGSILRPYVTRGWFWADELAAAKRAGVVSSVDVHEWVDYMACKCAPPVKAIEDLYLGRLDVGKNTPEGKSKKVVYNSAYGKFAQSIGMPKYGNAFYASRITSGCRRMILDAIASHPTKTDTLLMVATDSVVFAERHSTLDIHDARLGAWDETPHENLTLLMPGMYWDDKTREAIRDQKNPKLKSRGVPSTDLAKFVEEFDEQFTNRVEVPQVDVPIAFSIQSAKLAAHQGKWETCGRVTHDGVRRITADPIAKRVPSDRLAEFGLDAATFGPYVGRQQLPDGRTVIRSMPHFDGFDGEESEPYARMFGREAENEDDTRLFADVLTPDGPMDMLFSTDLKTE